MYYNHNKLYINYKYFYILKLKVKELFFIVRYYFLFMYKIFKKIWYNVCNLCIVDVYTHILYKDK